MSIIVPLFALLAGVAGFFIRLMEHWNVFNKETGLPERGSPITIALIALVAGVLILCLVFTILAGKRYTSPKGFDNAYGTESLAYPFVITVFSIVWIAASVKYYFEMDALGAVGASSLYFAILSIIAAISLLLFAIEMYQDPRRKAILALSVIPVVFMCYWLIYMYKQNATNPVLLSYCYYCLAIMASTLSFYYTAGFAYNKQAPGKAIFIYLATILFSLITLADSHATSINLIFAAIIAVSVVHSSMLIRNLTAKSDAQEPPGLDT